MIQFYTLKVLRGFPGKQYWEEFSLRLSPSSNLISAFMEIQCNPINKQGERVTPIAWEAGCLEEVCGSCSILVNGFPRQACTALIEPLLKATQTDTIIVAPFSKFPLIKDLMVDRSQMFESLKKVHAWIDVDDSFERGAGPKISPEKQQILYSLSTCMTCGCCSESCPQVNKHSKFIGPAPISDVRRHNAHPTGHTQKSLRLHPLMEEGGISDCGNNQNCVKVCPKNIPLTDSIAAISRNVVSQFFEDIFTFPENNT